MGLDIPMAYPEGMNIAGSFQYLINENLLLQFSHSFLFLINNLIQILLIIVHNNVQVLFILILSSNKDIVDFHDLWVAELLDDLELTAFVFLVNVDFLHGVGFGVGLGPEFGFVYFPECALTDLL